MTAAVIVSLRVVAAPEDTFDAFTRDIGLWWRPNSLFAISPCGDGALRFEPGPGGRLVTELPSGKVFQIGRVTRWEPGRRLAFEWQPATFRPGWTTEVDVRFEQVGDETRVTVEHRGWDAIPEDHAARHGFPLMIFQRHLAAHWRHALEAVRDQLEARV